MEVNIMPAGDKTRDSWKDPEVRARRITALKAAWTPEKRAEHSVLCATLERKPHYESKEVRKKKSEQYSGEGNPFFGKKHSAATKAKLQRPKGIVSLGMSLEEYGQHLANGERWCIGHNAFMSIAHFSKSGSRNGLTRRGSRCKECMWGKWLKKAYGVNSEWYRNKLQEQGGHCALCPAIESEEGRPLCVDHDHKTGAVRGLLCRRCNSLLERFEIPGWGDAALNFLNKPAAVLDSA